MSNRAAPGSKLKAERMASKKNKTQAHADDLAIGLNSGVRKLIGDDEVLCMECLVTKNGPDSVCSCKGGRSKPSPDFDDRHALIAAAKARSALASKAKAKAAAAAQGSVQKARLETKKEKEEGSCLEADATTLIGEDANELVQRIDFEVAKMGFKIMKNAVNDLDEGQAEGLGVKVGWVIQQVNETVITSGNSKAQPKKEIMKAITKASKEGAVFGISFRVPVTEGELYCVSCDKFLSEAKFNWDEQCSGPGGDICKDCEAFSGMEF